jgi:hypothetical protein
MRHCGEAPLRYACRPNCFRRVPEVAFFETVIYFLFSDLDSIDRNAADQVPTVQIQVLLVVVEPGGFFTVEPFYLPGLMGMDR